MVVYISILPILLSPSFCLSLALLSGTLAKELEPLCCVPDIYIESSFQALITDLGIRKNLPYSHSNPPRQFCACAPRTNVRGRVVVSTRRHVGRYFRPYAFYIKYTMYRITSNMGDGAFFYSARAGLS